MTDRHIGTDEGRVEGFDDLTNLCANALFDAVDDRDALSGNVEVTVIAQPMGGS